MAWNCGTITRDGIVLQVFAGGPADPCRLAVRAASGRPAPGFSCTAPLGFDRAIRYTICSRQSGWVVWIPKSVPKRKTGPGSCQPVVYAGKRYAVWKNKVLCSYARATALRMLRRQDPYIYEFETARQARRWKCRIFPGAGTERGACYKQVEKRWILYFPAPK